MGNPGDDPIPLLIFVGASCRIPENLQLEDAIKSDTL
jgi:hypothetical protein